MVTNTKQTPKSCSCYQCRRGKHSKVGHYLINKMQRALRAEWRDKGRKQEDPVLSSAPMGNYFD